MTVVEVSAPQMSEVLLSRIPGLLTDVRDGLRESWPDYADFLETDPAGMEKIAARFVRRLLELSDCVATDPRSGPRTGDEPLRWAFEQVGRGQLQEGNDLTHLFTAFQLGGRVAWRHVAAVALELDVPPASLVALADAVFEFVNELSFAAARGYILEQTEDARTRERNREELADMLLSGCVGLETARAAAYRAGWRVPDTIAVVLVNPADEAARAVVDRLAFGCLPIRQPGLYGAIVPDPEAIGGRAQLRRQLRGANAVVGVGVDVSMLPGSAESAQAAQRLMRSGVLHGDPLFAEDHRDSIIVWRDEALLDALRRQVLAPLDGYSQGSRLRLEETLRSWLGCLGDRQSMAEELSIHPQTVRYRMAQLREAFGGDLESPRTRARLCLALGWPST